MRRLALVALALLLAALSLAAAENKWSGTYVGDWSSNLAGVKGSFRMKLTPLAAGKWQCEVVFTLNEQKVETVIKSLNVGDSKIEVSYEFELADNKLLSTITGELAGNKLEGRYQTKTVPDGNPVDEGVWKTTSQKE